jgi:hypothetical protein
MPWLRWLVAGLPLWRCGFYPRPVHMRFVVNKVALGQVFLSVIKLSPVSIILPMLHTHLWLQAAGIRRTHRQGLGTLKWISAFPEVEGIGKNSTFIFFHQLHVVDVSAHIVNEFLMDQDVIMYMISILNWDWTLLSDAVSLLYWQEQGSLSLIVYYICFAFKSPFSVSWFRVFPHLNGDFTTFFII